MLFLQKCSIFFTHPFWNVYCLPSLTHFLSMALNYWKSMLEKLTFSAVEQLLLASVPCHYHFKAEIGTLDTGWLKTNFLFFFSSNYLPQQNCQNRNFLSVGDGGRLGNLMSQYATLWAASKLVPTKVLPVITSTMHTALTKIFPNISIPKMPQCNGSYNWSYIDIKVHLGAKMFTPL